jgi:membrane protein implicated in regulation of membrane protease activity
MVALGLLLLLASGLLTAALVVQSTDAVHVAALGQSVTGMTVGGLFLAGVITGAVAILGVMLLVAGAGRRRSRRTGLKRQVRDVRGEKETLAEENARLHRDLEAARSESGVYPADDTVAHDGETTRHGLFHR